MEQVGRSVLLRYAGVHKVRYYNSTYKNNFFLLAITCRCFSQHGTLGDGCNCKLRADSRHRASCSQHSLGNTGVNSVTKRADDCVPSVRYHSHVRFRKFCK
jgi:hypothetical protein